MENTDEKNKSTEDIIRRFQSTDRREKKNEIKILDQIMAKNFLKLIKHNKPNIHKAS